MSDKCVVVWRSNPGSAVQTYAKPDKSPRIFQNKSENELEGATWADADALAALLEDREPFEPRMVPLGVASSLLGWDLS